MGVRSEAARLTRRGREILRRRGPLRLAVACGDKAIVFAAYPLHAARLQGETFTVGGERLPYFAHHYNATWRSERIVEIPIARRFLRGRRDEAGLEVGNVLSHYSPEATRTIVDKYERAPGVLAVDVLDHRPERPPEHIVSISTIEHVGWDEEPRDEDKAVAAIGHLQGILAPAGRMLITCPRGYHPVLDRAIADGSLEPSTEFFLTRPAHRNRWHEQNRSEALNHTPYYDHRHRNAHDLWVAEWSGPSVCGPA